MIKGSKKRVQRVKRAFRVRKKLKGTAIKPRLCVNKSNQHLYLQLIDDEAGTTIGSCSTVLKQFSGRNRETAKQLGSEIAKIAGAKQIKEVIFDRGSHKYHGILVEMADAARNGGLKF